MMPTISPRRTPAASASTGMPVRSTLPSTSGPDARTGMSKVGMLPDMGGDWVGPPPVLGVKVSSERKRTVPAARRLMATPLTMWSTPKVTVARACSRPPRAPPMRAATSAASGPQRHPAKPAPQTPSIIMPSRPMLTTPARSLIRPPRPARATGRVSHTIALMVPDAVRTPSPEMTRVIERATNPRPARSSRRLRRARRATVVAVGADAVEVLMPTLLRLPVRGCRSPRWWGPRELRGSARQPCGPPCAATCDEGPR